MKRTLIKEILRIRTIMGLNEGEFGDKTLINVDIQPEYQNSLSFKLHEWGQTVNNHSGKIVFLYNGADTLGMISEYDYKIWLVEEVGISEDIVYDRAYFYDKGYAFFRYCIDNYIDDEEIVNLVKFMISHNINDSRDLTEEFWDEFINQYGHQSIRELVEFASDCIHIPDLMDYLRQYNNIVICGGGMNECLKEVEIALQALNKPFDKYKRFIYEKVISETVTKKRVICDNCGWSWNKSEGGNDIYICHKCGCDNTPHMNENTLSGKMVWDHIKNITPYKADIPWGFEKKIINAQFSLVPDFDLKSLLVTDPDFKEYYDSGDMRYDDYDDEIDAYSIENEIVVVDGELLDGYSRASTLLRNGTETTSAYVGKNKDQENESLEERTQKPLLNEKLTNIDDDVNMLYELYFKKTVEEIEATKTLKRKMFAVDETDTSVLKNELCVRAHEINPCKIQINQNKNLYAPTQNIISISFNLNVVSYIIDDFDGNYQEAIDYQNGLNKNTLRKEFTEERIKGSIHHELVHWIDDTLNNRHLTKMINKRILQASSESKPFDNKAINAHYSEMQAQIHNIKQLHNKYSNIWDTLSFEDMIYMSPALAAVHKMLPYNLKMKWIKKLKIRMYREQLLGKKMFN